MIADRGERAPQPCSRPGPRALFGLEVLAADIQAERSNRTRFLVLARPGCSGLPDAATASPDGSRRSALVFSVRNEPGTLVRALGVIADHRINMTKLESRPSREGTWEYVFWVDLDADVCPGARGRRGLPGGPAGGLRLGPRHGLLPALPGAGHLSRRARRRASSRHEERHDQQLIEPADRVVARAADCAIVACWRSSAWPSWRCSSWPPPRPSGSSSSAARHRQRRPWTTRCRCCCRRPRQAAEPDPGATSDRAAGDGSGQASVMVTERILTGCSGRSWGPVAAVAMASTTSSPALSLPKMV